MRVGVHPDGVSLLDDLAHALQIGFIRLAGDKESRLDALFGQRRKHLVRPDGGAVVKGQIDRVLHALRRAVGLRGVEVGVQRLIGGGIVEKRLGILRVGGRLVLIGFGRGGVLRLKHRAGMGDCVVPEVDRIGLPRRSLRLTIEFHRKQGRGQDQHADRNEDQIFKEADAAEVQS